MLPVDDSDAATATRLARRVDRSVAIWRGETQTNIVAIRVPRLS